jgi:hypothetical protein
MKLPKQTVCNLVAPLPQTGTLGNSLLPNAHVRPQGCCAEVCVNTPLGQICHCVASSPWC